MCVNSILQRAMWNLFHPSRTLFYKDDHRNPSILHTEINWREHLCAFPKITVQIKKWAKKFIFIFNFIWASKPDEWKRILQQRTSNGLKDKINFQARLLQRLCKSYIPLPSASGLQGGVDSVQLFVLPPNLGWVSVTDKSTELQWIKELCAFHTRQPVSVLISWF